MRQNPYMPIAATIDHIVEETASIKTFGLRPQEPIAFQAGQFVELTVPGIGEAPFTPSSSPAVTEQMEITIMRVGRVTEALHEMSVGDTVGIRGPYGQAYPIEKFRGREVLIVGGGCGVGPLRVAVRAVRGPRTLSAYSGACRCARHTTWCSGTRLPIDGTKETKWMYWSRWTMRKKAGQGRWAS